MKRYETKTTLRTLQNQNINFSSANITMLKIFWEYLENTSKKYGLKKSEYLRLLVMYDMLLKQNKNEFILYNYGITLEENDLENFIKEMKFLANKYDIKKRVRIYSYRHKRK